MVFALLLFHKNIDHGKLIISKNFHDGPEVEKCGLYLYSGNKPRIFKPLEAK